MRGWRKRAGPWILLSLDTHNQCLYNVNKNGLVVSDVCRSELEIISCILYHTPCTQ